MAMRSGPLRICVIGGGFTGLAGAIALLSHVSEPFRLVIVEPNGDLGRGVAYGAYHPLHLLNVRAGDLSISASRPGDFLNWAFTQLDQGENDGGLHEGLAHSFLPRQLFGQYVQQRFFEAVKTRGDVELSIVNSEATGCFAESGGFRIHFDRREPLTADIVFLATAYGLQQASSTGALSPFEPLPSNRLAGAKSMVLVGSGLTMVDALLNARRNGFQGRATVVSRRGQLPRPHAPKGVGSHPISLPPFKRVSLLASALRLACTAAESHGTPWQAVINGLRPSLQDLWEKLPTEEQGRFLRHLRPFWDAHRHRLPMEIHAQLRAELGAGQAVLLQGRARHVVRHPGGFKITFTRRGSSAVETIEADLAFDCSGHRPDLASRLIATLLSQRLARSDAHGLGLAVRSDGQVLGRDDIPTPGLFALGPLGQGSLWEITAVPEIVTQADQAAKGVASQQQKALRAVR